MNRLKIKNENLDDCLLWSQLKAGDEEAFSLLFEKYYGLLVNYGKTLNTESEIVKDCIQDVFVDIWNYRNTLNEARVVKAYLLSSVRKRIVRLHERNHIFSNTINIDSIDFLYEYSIEDRLIADETMVKSVKKINQLINSLPARQSEALYLRYHQGLTVDQVSEVLNINYQSTKNLLHRAILQLRKEFPLTVLITILSVLSTV
ncbi:sigma-70 family RNA polymerase sigma factor [Daejeonella sp.]|uniref:RNA polymerase sigma factor n=1 Tax=Daejeonella sp. TaxID=2805397 RepID=UPI0025C0AAF7|nr:sigma-70 family RNA polymerase sigma factor [Daejeonella sp.]